MHGNAINVFRTPLRREGVKRNKKVVVFELSQVNIMGFLDVTKSLGKINVVLQGPR